MNDGDKKRFAVAMNWLADKYPKDGEPRTLSKQDLADLFRALKGISIDGLEFATEMHFKTKAFFPRPFELIEAARGYRGDTTDPSRQLPAPALPPDLLEQYHADSRATMAFVQTDAPLEEKLFKLELMARSYPQFEWQDAREGMEAVCTKLQAANRERYERIAEMRKNTFADST